MALPRAMPTKSHLLKYIHFYRYWSQSKIKRISWTLSNHVCRTKWALIVYAFTVKSIVSLNIPHINLNQILSKQWMWQFLHHIKGLLGIVYRFNNSFTIHFQRIWCFIMIVTFYNTCHILTTHTSANLFEVIRVGFSLNLKLKGRLWCCLWSLILRRF